MISRDLKVSAWKFCRQRDYWRRSNGRPEFEIAGIHPQTHSRDCEPGRRVNQFISSAVSEKVSAILTEEYINARAGKADFEKVEQTFANVPEPTPIAGDEL